MTPLLDLGKGRSGFVAIGGFDGDFTRQRE